jgi:hypothetical protein
MAVRTAGASVATPGATTVTRKGAAAAAAASTTTIRRGILRFLSGWVESSSGEIRAGRPLVIEYDPERVLDSQPRRRGTPTHIAAHLRFHPGDQSYTGSLLQHHAGDPPVVLDPPEPTPCELKVPADAAQVELWFETTDRAEGRVWDSCYGANYWFAVAPAAGTIPWRSVAYRWGATPSLEMVNVLGEAATKSNAFPQPAVGYRHGADFKTRLFIQAWVRNVAYRKSVWVDVHAFDHGDQLIHSETFPLTHLSPAGGGGDLFMIDRTVYQGSTATPGSVSPKPDARKIQYRLYYEADGQVFTDALLHQHELPEDAVTR